MSRRRRPPAVDADRGTPERAQHGVLVEEVAERTSTGQVIAVRRRAQPPIERIDGLSDEMRGAAERLRRDWEVAVWLIDDRDRPVTPIVQRSRPIVEPADAAIDASRRIDRARQAMGAYIADVVVAVVCEEISARAVARTRGQDRQEIVGVLKSGLTIVARCYGLMRAAA